MASLRETGEYFRLALALGLIDPSDVIPWADAVIQALEAPPAELIDVSLAERLSRVEMMNRLSALPGCVDREAAAHCALGLLREMLRNDDITLHYAVKALEAYFNWADVPEAEGLRALNFDDALFCAEQGYCGTPDTVRTELEEFLAEYGSDPEVNPGGLPTR